MSDFKKLAQEIGPSSVNPEAMAKLAEEMRVTRERRTHALWMHGSTPVIDNLEKVIQELDFARIQIEDVRSTEGALTFIAAARERVIKLLGIDQE